MSIGLLLEMAASNDPDRIAVTCDELRWTIGRLDALADGGAGVIERTGAQHVVYVGTGGALLPLLLFSAARSAIPFSPLNYRLSSEALAGQIKRLPSPLVVADGPYFEVVADLGVAALTSADFVAAAESSPAVREFADPDATAVVLFTSGTTARPKAVELSHHNLTSYVTGTVEFDSAAAGDAALICVPPYHIAGVGAALSNPYAGRKMVYLTQFDARRWVQLVQDEGVTAATVVPTMLDRIATVLTDEPTDLPTLRTLAYGGAKVGLPLVRKALDLLPAVGFVNAYGLTETSSTISVLTPDDHRTAQRSDEPEVRRRLTSVGQPVPGIEIEIRDDLGAVVEAGQTGELFVRGDQVSGRYAEIGSLLDPAGWFATRDVASVDAGGYLFIGGRSDDTIIRGGENIAPAEIEDVLVEHPQVHHCVVVGVDDAHWGQAIVAVVVPVGHPPDPAELCAYVRARLRGSRTPDRIEYRNELPVTATGKVLRRQLADELTPPPTRQREDA